MGPLVALDLFSIAEVQTKVINCNSANKSCLLQVVHTKIIAALTQFCDFLFFVISDSIIAYSSRKIISKEKQIENISFLN